MTAERQTSDTVLLVRPSAFGFHPEAASSNAFATASRDSDIHHRATAEFDGLANRLSNAGVEVLILDDSPEPSKPDAIFPNNWVSFHSDGTVVLYPMATVARRLERNLDGLTGLLRGARFDIARTVDLSSSEQSGHFLEGTGSLVLDRTRGIAFANRSPRTDPEVIAEFDRRLGYSTFVFDAFDRGGRPIYHTNVLLSLGTDFAILCTEAVGPQVRGELVERIRGTKRELIEVDYEQMCKFACNIIELRDKSGTSVIVMSSTALESLRPDQRRRLEGHGSLLDAGIPTIETVGGGSVRCMIADVHLPRR